MIKHYTFFLYALRTALIFIAGFLSYDILKIIENEWNKNKPNNQITHLAKRKVYHFIIIFICDLIILYLIYLLFNVHL
jgi:hypothetical protein